MFPQRHLRLKHVCRGIWHFHLSLLKGLCARVRCKTEAIKTVWCDSITQMRPFCSLIFMALTWLTKEFRIVNWNVDSFWYADPIK